MFSSKVQRTITIQDDEGGDVTVILQKLTDRKLREASDAQSLAYYAMTKTASKALLDAQRDSAKATEAATPKEAVTEDPDTIAARVKAKHKARCSGYDRDLVLRAGVKSWSVDAKLPGALDDLDATLAERFHLEILDLSLPAIDPETEETARKNA